MKGTTKSQVKAALYHHGIISIIRGAFTPGEMVQLAWALHAGGVRAVEVTLNSPHALDGIRALCREAPDEMLVGAGTVRTADDVQRAVDAGARYLIAPNLDLAAVREAERLEVLLVPGVFTATEAQNAFMAGCSTVKLFPADALGPSYLRALRAPLEQIDFIPSGGVNPDTVADFHRAGAVAFGVGSALIRNEPIDEAALAALGERARALCAALRAALGAS